MERTCRRDGCDTTFVVVPQAPNQTTCSQPCYAAQWRRRKKAEKQMVEPDAKAGFIIVDRRLKVGIGPFQEEDEGVRFMVRQGHDDRDLLAVIATTPDVWLQTGVKAICQ